EHALALILACARKVCLYDADVHRGNWSLKIGIPLFRVSGGTLGILGFGKIGQALANKAQGLGLRIIAYSPHLNPDRLRQHQIEAVTLDQLLEQSDFLSVHSPLTPETRGLLNAERLRQMKPTSYLINTARGAIVD